MDTKMQVGPTFQAVNLYKTLNLPLKSGANTKMERDLAVAGKCASIKKTFSKKNKDVHVFAREARDKTDTFNFFVADGGEAKLLNDLKNIQKNLSTYNLPKESAKNKIILGVVGDDIRATLKKLEDLFLSNYNLSK